MKNYNELMIGYAIGIAAVVYINTPKIDHDKHIPYNNIEAILNPEDKKKKYVNTLIKIKDNDRYKQEPNINHEKNYQKHAQKQYNRRMMNMRLKFNSYDSNIPTLYFRNDRRNIVKKTLVIY